MLADFGTKSYIVGSTNSLLLQQKDRYSDILINLDEDTVSITSSSLRNALALTPADRRWIDYLTYEINETWDDANPSIPKTMQYAGSEEFIRSQFESYILGLISSVKLHNYMLGNNDGATLGETDPAVDFGLEWVEAWTQTENYRMWHANTDSNLFAVSEPKHPCAGGLTVEDIQRRVADQVKELHLDERFAQGRDILGRNFAAGQKKASTMLNRIYSDVEYLRESQRRRAEDSARAQDAKSPTEQSSAAAAAAYPNVDLTKAQQTVQTAGARAGAYMSSWASWAGEKRKTGGWGGWGRKGNPQSPKPDGSAPASPVEKTDIDKDYQMISPPETRATSTEATAPPVRHTAQDSFSESILSGVSSLPSRPTTRDDQLSPGIKDTEKASDADKGDDFQDKEKGQPVFSAAAEESSQDKGHDGQDTAKDKAAPVKATAEDTKETTDKDTTEKTTQQ